MIVIEFVSSWNRRKVEEDRDGDEEIGKKEKEVPTDVTRSVIGRTAYANAASGPTGMR